MPLRAPRGPAAGPRLSIGQQSSPGVPWLWRLSRRRFPIALWLVMMLALLVLGVSFGVWVMLVGNFTVTFRSAPTHGVSSPQNSQPTAAPTAGAYQIGETVIYNGHWQITLTSATTTAREQRFARPTPQPGDTYLVIEGTFKNLQDHADVLSTLAECDLRDSQGNVYIEAVLFGITPPDGSLAAGDSTRGAWAYQVPATDTRFTLTFSEDGGQTSVAWNIIVP